MISKSALQRFECLNAQQPDRSATFPTRPSLSLTRACPACNRLTEVWGIESAVQPRSGAHGVGLYTTRSVVRGEASDLRHRITRMPLFQN